MKTESVITVEKQEISKRSVRKSKGTKVNKENKTQVQQIAEVAEGSCLDPWPVIMQEDTEDEIGSIEVNEMMNRMCEN